ncbi:MAG TPA: GPW/gp25 family protein [Bryobacteraceae bacterium]|nr:GPW/gp25 family protein [Bryobacteraceae bacterium]
MPVSPSRVYTGIGWKFPVQVRPGGQLIFSSGEQNIEDSIWIILATARGERQMLPRFGCGIHDLVFAPNNPSTQGNVAHLVKDALTEWEPRIDVLDVNVSAPPGDANTLLIRVDYRIRSNNTFGNMVYPFYITEGVGQ